MKSSRAMYPCLHIWRWKHGSSCQMALFTSECGFPTNSTNKGCRILKIIWNQSPDQNIHDSTAEDRKILCPCSKFVSNAQPLHRMMRADWPYDNHSKQGHTNTVKTMVSFTCVYSQVTSSVHLPCHKRAFDVYLSCIPHLLRHQTF